MLSEIAPAGAAQEQQRNRRLRIVKLTLHNVKSYGPRTTIELAPGINAICGENGAGKSTILEGIGFALFGYRPYKLEAFLREGEKSGSITVTVEDEDGCSFDVVRKLGTSGGQAVYDELGARVAEGEADVRNWVIDRLQLEPGTDIAQLFEDTVGPPQGTLTAIFLQTASTRRQKFNELLGIEDYRKAADGLKAVRGVFRDEATEADRQAALLEGDARRLPEVEARRAELTERQAALGQELQGLLSRQDGLLAERTRLDKEKDALAAAESQLSVAEGRARECARRRDESGAELARAEEAARAVEESRPGYIACKEAEERLRKLNARRQERDSLRQRAELAARTALQQEHKVSTYSEQLASLERDAARAAELELRVPEQEKREGAVREAEGKLRSRDEASRQLEAAEGRLKTAEERLREAEKRLAEVAAAGPLAAELAELRDRERALHGTKARLEQQLLALRQSGDGLAGGRRRLEQLLQSVAELSGQVEDLRPLEDLAVQFPSRQQQRDEAASVLASVEARYKEALRTRSQVDGGLCPFFHEPCKNLRPGLSLDGHFDGVIASTAAELDGAKTRLSSVEAGLAEARSAERAFSRLPDLERQLRQLAESQTKLEEEVGRLERQRAELAAIPEEQARVEEQLRALGPRLEKAEAAWKIASGEAGWRSQASEAARALETERQTAALSRSQVEAGAGAEDALARALAAQKEWGDPRGEAAALRARVAREGPTVQRELERARRDAGGARVAEETARRALEPFAQLEEEIAGATAIREQSQAAHDRFIASQAEAGRLEERRSAHAKAAREAELAAEALATASAAAEMLRESYDEAAHLRLREALEEMAARTAGVRTELALRQKEEAQLLEELSSLSRIRREMETLQQRAARARELQDIVDTIRRLLEATGPEIGKALRHRVSDVATSLYRELLGQPTVSLEWREDYDIRCRIRAEEREFKQLSGGEQMAAALAVRLALLQTISNLRFAFLDEPTAHMDATRRFNLAAQIQNLRSFDQLVVISHDDSFDTLFGHVIRLSKRDGVTVVED